MAHKLFYTGPLAIWESTIVPRSSKVKANANKK